MKIIEYTLGLPPYRRGGLTQYSLDCASELAKEDQVFLLYPGQINPLSRKKLHICKVTTPYRFQTYELRNPLPVALGLGISDPARYYERREITAFKNFINKVQPDVVHLHTLMGLPLAILRFLHAQGIRIVYTTHDYYGLCPKMLTADPVEQLKNSVCTDDCMLCSPGPSYSKVLVMQSHLYQRMKETTMVKGLRRQGKQAVRQSKDNGQVFSTEVANQHLQLRQYYAEMFKLVDCFHFNSSVARDYYQQFFPEIQGKVIPITHAGLVDHRKERAPHPTAPLKIGYVGPYDQKKGFTLLKEALLGMDNHQGWQAEFFGDILDDDLFSQPNVTNHGIIPAAKMPEALAKLDLLVMPSRWHETFGLVGLEALLVGTPCLMSERVGAKDLIPEEWVFTSQAELEAKLNNLINTPTEVTKMMEFVKQINLTYSLSSHIEKLRQAVLLEN